MPKEGKYKRQREFLAALGAGKFDSSQTSQKTHWERLQEVLTRREYDNDSFFYWYQKFVHSFANDPSKRTSRKRSNKTLEKAWRRFRIFAEYCVADGLDRRSLRQFEAQDFDSFLDRYKNQTRTARQMFIDIRQAFNFMVASSKCPLRYNPLNERAVPHHVVKHTPTMINPDRVFEFLYAAINHYERKGTLKEQERQRALDLAVLGFMILTAARRAGVASLRLNNIRWHENECTYFDKGKWVEADITDVKSYLADYRERRNFHGQRKDETKSNYLARISEFNRCHATELGFEVQPNQEDDVFFRRHDGFPATSDTIASIVRRFEKWSNEGNFDVKLTPHVIRKYRGQQVWAQTKDLELCRMLLNHNDYGTTQIYLELGKGAKFDGMRATSPLKALFKGHGG